MIGPIGSPAASALNAPGGVQQTDPNAPTRAANARTEQTGGQPTQTRDAVPPAPPSGSGRGGQLDIQV